MKQEEEETNNPEAEQSLDSTPKDLSSNEEKAKEGPQAHWENHLIRQLFEDPPKGNEDQSYIITTLVAAEIPGVLGIIQLKSPIHNPLFGKENSREEMPPRRLYKKFPKER